MPGSWVVALGLASVSGKASYGEGTESVSLKTCHKAIATDTGKNRFGPLSLKGSFRCGRCSETSVAQAACGCQLLALSQGSLPPCLPSLWDLKPGLCPPHPTSPPPSPALNQLLHHCLTRSDSSKHTHTHSCPGKMAAPPGFFVTRPRPIFH